MLEIQSTDDQIGAAIASRLRPFRAPAARPEVLVAINVGGPRPADLDRLPWGGGRPVYESPAGQVRFIDSEDLLLLYSKEAQAWARPAAGELTMSAPTADPSSSWLLTHPFLTLPLMEMLKRRSVFAIHAGAVATRSGAVLLAGPSGAGKTTLSIALANHGLGFLGDDLAFLARANAGERPWLLPFADEVDLLPDAARHFPQLEPAMREARPSGSIKHSLRLEDALDIRLAPACVPSAVVLLGERAGALAPSVEVLPAGPALLDLVPNVLLTESVSSQAHLDALGNLTRTCPCYRLHAGDDLAQNVGAVVSLLG